MLMIRRQPTIFQLTPRTVPSVIFALRRMEDVITCSVITANTTSAGCALEIGGLMAQSTMNAQGVNFWHYAVVNWRLYISTLFMKVQSCQLTRNFGPNVQNDRKRPKFRYFGPIFEKWV